MKINRKIRRQFRLQQAIFYLLLITVVALLSKVAIDTDHQFDLTANSRNTLSATSTELLQQLDQPIDIEVFVSPQYEYRSAITELLQRYQQHSKHLNIHYIDPAAAPDKVRQLAIQQQGEMVVSRGDQNQHVFDLSEQSLTNAIVTVSRKKQPWLVFIEGHDERSVFAQGNASLSTWARQLQSQGFKLHAQNLAVNSTLPENTAVLVIASPLRDWLPGEVDIVRDYIDNGGNVLWLADPNQPESLTGLAQSLGIEFSAGTVLDPNAAQLNLTDPRFILVQDYANHPIGAATANVTLLADVVAIQTINLAEDANSWTYLNLINSQPETWLENSSLQPDTLSSQTYDVGSDVPGPLALGYILTKQLDAEKQQRIAIIGDSDFVTNAYIGTLANLELAMATVNWLSGDDQLITIPIKTSIGTQLMLSRTQSMVIGFGFLVVLPLLLLATGLLIWWRRRRR